MQVKQLLTDDDAVSPVIGVILMVAITVILAAVIAAFVLGLGDTNSVAPNVSFDYDYDGSQLDITVTSGDTFDPARVTIESGGSELVSAPAFGSGGSQVGAGATETGISVTAGNTVRIIWESESGDTSSEIGTFDVPE